MPFRASSSEVDRFHTANSVLPRTYSHRSTIVPRTDFLLKSWSSASVTGVNSYVLGRAAAPPQSVTQIGYVAHRHLHGDVEITVVVCHADARRLGRRHHVVRIFLREIRNDRRTHPRFVVDTAVDTDGNRVRWHAKRVKFLASLVSRRGLSIGARCVRLRAERFGEQVARQGCGQMRRPISKNGLGQALANLSDVVVQMVAVADDDRFQRHGRVAADGARDRVV